MAKEIERKFLVKADAWHRPANGEDLRQGYLSTEEQRSVRVRTVRNESGQRGYITIKGRSYGASRDEYEYEIPFSEANEILEHLCRRPLIEKIRYRISFEGLTWEVDEFRGENRGLIVAEVELNDEKQPVAKPDWVTDEVTGDSRYYNTNLATRPFSSW